MIHERRDRLSICSYARLPVTASIHPEIVCRKNNNIVSAIDVRLRASRALFPALAIARWPAVAIRGSVRRHPYQNRGRVGWVWPADDPVDRAVQ